MSRSKGWCFTINNYTEVDEQQVKDLATHKHLKYIVCGKEVGKEGTPHLQGYCYMNVEKSLKAMSGFLSRASLRMAKGSAEQNFDYCSKDGDFVEYGIRPMSSADKGKRGREYWDEQLSLAKKGRIEECDAKLQLTHMSSLLKCVSYYAPMPPDADDVCGEWYYGETGTGKSRKAREDNPGHYLKLCNKWWDGYDGEEVAIIEDFDKQHAVLGYHLKIWADRYAFPAEVKGGKINIRPKKIIVTSNYHPEEIWSNEPKTLDPILRRFKITRFSINLNQAFP